MNIVNNWLNLTVYIMREMCIDVVDMNFMHLILKQIELACKYMT